MPRVETVLASRGFWLTLYVGAVLTPLVVLTVVPTPAKWGFWWDIGIGLGFAGLVMMSIQFILTARFRRACAPFGMDLIYFFHRFLAYVLLVVVLAHPVILVAIDRSLLADLNPFSAPWPVTAGVLSLVLLVVLVVTSAGRKLFRIPYDAWKIAHLLLSVLAVALAFGHMRGIGYYSATSLASGLWMVIGLSLIVAVFRVRVVRPWQMLRRPYRVVEVKAEPGNTWRLALEPAGHAGFGFQPGQFVWIVLRRSPFLMKEHPFSIASSPKPGGQIELAIKERGKFTQSIREIQPGEVAYIDGPYGVFSIDRRPDAHGYVFISGGIGLAPMMSMIQALDDRQDRRQHLLITAHSRLDRIAFRAELAEIQSRINLKVVYVLEDPPESWDGERGWLNCDLLSRHLPSDRTGYQYFICGPVPMIRIAETGLHSLGVPPQRVHSELFDLV